MENAISTFCKSLASFCHHAESSSRTLSESIHRRPLPLDSAAASFMQTLDRRISSTGGDLNLLESMAFGTVSVEELLGHCNEVYKTNQSCIADLQDRMRDFGYIPELELDGIGDEDLEADTRFLTPENEREAACGSVSVAFSSRKRLEDDLLFEDCISLQNIGLSDACLATLASEENENPTSMSISVQHNISLGAGQTNGKKLQFDRPTDAKNGLDINANGAMIEASKKDYDNLPSYMKSLASHKELQEAVAKMNSYICKKDGSKGSHKLNQDDVEMLGLGHKGKSYLLLLIRMNQLAVENIDGSIFYCTRSGC